LACDAPLLPFLDPPAGLGLQLAVEVLDLAPDALHTLGDLLHAVDQTPLHWLGEVDAADLPRQRDLGPQQIAVVPAFELSEQRLLVGEGRLSTEKKA